MSVEHRLFQALMDDPDNIELRMVIADWYQEQGDPRGEFIQVQIALDRLPRDHSWRPEMKVRERDLLTEHRKEWDAPLYRQINATPFKGQVRSRRGLIRGWEYRRGFVEHLGGDAASVMDSIDTFLGLGPLCSLRLWNVAPVAARLARWEGLSRFTNLDLRHNDLGDVGIQGILMSPHLMNLQVLRLVDTGLTDLSLDRLTAEDQLPALRRLVLSQNHFTREGWERLLFRFGEKLEHENGHQPLTSYLNQSVEMEPEFESYDDEVLYDSGRIHTEGKRQVDGEWVEDYDEYEGFEEFDEDGLKYLGGYQDAERADDWIGPNHEPDFENDGREEEFE